MSQRTNEDWLTSLRATGEQQALALDELRQLVLRGLPFALAGKLAPDDPRFAALTEEVAQDTLLRVLANLESYEGRAAFTTWVHKIAVRQALGELRRRRWRDVPLPEMEMSDEGETAPREVAASQAGPELLVERKDLLRFLDRVMAEELTAKQRLALSLVTVRGMPLEEAAQRMGMNRNALYKLLHDARLKLKRSLEAYGLTPRDMLASFERMTG